jgi:hypothetical protein
MAESYPALFLRDQSRRRLTTVPAAIKYCALVSFLVSNSLGEVLFRKFARSISSCITIPIHGGT